MDLDLRPTDADAPHAGTVPPALAAPDATAAHVPATARPLPADLGDRPNVEVTQNSARGVAVAQGLGWFSLGLGAAELLAPRALGKLIGLPRGGGALMRLLGVRELAAGFGLLGTRRAAWWTGARTAGDLMDLALLAFAFTRPGNDRGRLTAAAVAVLGAAAVDAWATRTLAGDLARQEQVAGVTHVGKAITIDAPAASLYAFWRDLGNLPRIMDHLRAVEPLADGRSRWVASGPQNTTVRWDTEVVEDQPDQLIAWRTVRGPFESSGSVRFLPAPGGRGTEVVVDMHYQLTGGLAGKLVALFAGREPGLEVARGLRVLKQLFELGEPMRSDASIHRGLHPARPPSDRELDVFESAHPTPGGH